MIVNPFTIDVIKDYRMFFMLQKLNASSGDIDIYCQEIDSDIPFEGCSLFEMNNEYILVAFPDEYREQAKHNLIATNGTVSEVINLQSFERIYNYYKLGVDSEDHGGFTFMNSAAVPSFANQWRCDAGMYGVEFFADPTGDTVIDIPDEADELLVYEPIFSINGTAHLIYTERKNKTNKIKKTCQAKMDRVHGNHNINQIVEESNQIVPDKFQDKADLVLYNQLINQDNK
jgi:hypothetical protein